ncbi:MAG: glycosyltransferase family 39 protein [Deltaproteobacteria bacterium]|nr:glycosyltransferase family 39 protein [Deltaproteobacteria bacterium]
MSGIRLWAALVLAAVMGGTAAFGSLYDGDEAVYAELARTMRETGDFLTLRLSGHPVHQRPPGYPWVLAAFTAVLGESELVLRLPSVVATAATAILLGSLVGRLAGSQVAGALAAVLFASLGMTWKYGRSVESDPLLVLLCVAAVERLVAAMEEEQAVRRRLAMFGALVGGACMVKQVVGLFPLLGLVSWIAARPGDLRRLARLSPWALVPAVVVWAPWHIAMSVAHGRAFWQGYLGFNVVERAMRPLLAGTPPWYYLQVLWKVEGPVLASVLFIGLGAGLLRRSTALVVAIPAALALLAFSVAQSRVDYYLLVVTPFLSASVALLGHERFRPRARDQWITISLACMVAWASHGLPSAVPLERSREVRAVAEVAGAKARERGGARLVVVGVQPSAARYYSRLPTTRLLLDEAAYLRLAAIDVFAVPSALAHHASAVHACAWLREERTLVLARPCPDLDALTTAGCLGETLGQSGSVVLLPVK